MSQVIVLNADYTFLSTTSWQSAVCLLYEKKAETVKETTKIVRNATRTVEIVVPLVIRVIKYIRSVFKKSVPFSKRNVFVRDDQTCLYCGERLESFSDCTIDHVIPRAQGGTSTWENCVTSCRSCNQTKADRTPSQAGMYLKKKPKRPTINEHIQFFTKVYGIDDLLNSL